jgi:hypothetical protein
MPNIQTPKFEPLLGVLFNRAFIVPTRRVPNTVCRSSITRYFDGTKFASVYDHNINIDISK